MASQLEVKKYLAHWFQLGKKVYVRNGDFTMLPSKIFNDTDYSAEFDRCWKLISSDVSGDCYLEDTTQTIDDLLSPSWEVVDCARCAMPIPLKVAGISTESCPCVNLSHWPNNTVPVPIARELVTSKMVDIHHRLDR